MTGSKTAQRKGRPPSIRRKVFAATTAHRAERRSAANAEKREALDAAPKNRADLTRLPGWCDLPTDTARNPCVWTNSYACDCGCR